MAITVVNTSGSPIVVTGTTNTNDEVYTPSAGAGVKILWVYWYLPTTAGHLCALKTKDGKPILQMRCENANESQFFPLWQTWGNIYCDDMDSGTLYIYIR